MSTSVSSSPPKSSSSPKQNRPKQNRTVRRWVTAAAAILLIFVVFIVIRTQGFVSGQEFSPTHFQQRKFSFYEIPLIHLQITPIRRSGSTPKTATYLRQNTLIPPPTGIPTTWHLVSISRGLTGSTPADAHLLLDQLSLQSGGDDYWRKWSIDHPKHAKILWPVIQKLAQRELYLLMPPLFELAQIEQPPDRLQGNIDRNLKQEYRSLILDMRAAGRGELAQQLLLEVTKDYPDDRQLRNLRLNSSES